MELWTLGQLRLLDPAGTDISERIQPKRLALLLYIAHAPRRFHRRDALLALFWPEFDSSSARSSLRQSLYDLRSNLGKHVMQARGYSEVAVTDHLWSDVPRFESLLRSDTASAMELYKGDFAGGLHVHNVSPEFEDWLERERQRLKGRAIQAAIGLSDSERARGHHSEAIRWIRAAHQLDPENEAILVSLIDLLEKTGDPAGAIRAFETFETRIRDEYDLAPSHETYALIKALRRRTRRAELAQRVPPMIQRHLTSFIGRTRALDELESLVMSPATRILTLAGLGGIGKTRLAIQLADRIEDRFRDGGLLVSLGDPKQSEGVLAAIARGLGVSEDPRQDTLSVLCRHLAGYESLLILDGLKEVMPRRQIQALIGSAQGLKLIVTSRLPLNLDGEVHFPVQPLTLPEEHVGQTVHMALNSEAVALFVDRARAVRPDFLLTSKNLDSVVEICRRLDGLPLAIELAAARVKSLTPKTIAERLEHRFDFLTGPAAGSAVRRRTLEAAIAWSFNLLDESTRTLFRRLGVFSGGFGLDLLDALFYAEHVSDVELLDALASLVDHGLVSQSETAGEARFHMLDTVHAYAVKLLIESGEENAWRSRHAEIVSAWLRNGERHVCTDEQDDWFARLERDHENLRAAIQWAIEQENGTLAAQLGATLWPFWAFRGYMTEAEGWLGRVLALEISEAGWAARANALIGAAWVALSAGRDEHAIAFVEESVSLYRIMEDEPGEVRALETLGFIHLEYGRLGPARAAFEECLERSQRIPDVRRQTAALNGLGQVAFDEGKNLVAEDLFRESVRLARRSGQPHSVASGLLRLGDVAFRRGSNEEALRQYDEALATFQHLGQKLHVARALSSLGNVLLESGRMADASEMYRQSLAGFREVGYTGGIGRTLVGYAAIAFACEDAGRAARVLGGVSQLLECAGGVLPPEDAATEATLREGVRTRLREPEFTRLWNEGGALDPDALVILAQAGNPELKQRAAG